MVLSKALLLRGLGGVLAVGSVVAATCWGVMSLDETHWLSDLELIREVGLNCGETLEDGNVCGVIEDGKVNFERNGKRTTEINYLSTGKIKVYGNQSNYRRGLRFSIEERDIELHGDNNIPRLEEFENYEIQYLEEGDKRLPFLSRKTNAFPKIRALLGLPERCQFPEEVNDSKECQDLGQESLASIEFMGKNSNVTGGPATLTITKLDKPGYPLGYKFSLKAKASVSIGGDNDLPEKVSVDFRVGRNGDKLHLERDWKLSELAEKVGLECNENVCTLKTPSQKKLNVRRGDAKGEGIGSISGGNIKVYGNQKGYRGGFRFSIEGNDIVLGVGTGEVKRLGRFEDYEISSEGNKHHLTRKYEGVVEKIRHLGLPESCKDLVCTIEKDADFGGIKFWDLENSKPLSLPNGTKLEVKMAKEANESQWPGGLRISFNPGDNEVKMPRRKGGNFILWKNQSTDYRIKNSGGNWSLERVSGVEGLAKKAGLTDCIDDLGCKIGEKIDIFLNNDNYVVEGKVKNNFRNKRIKYQVGAEGYSEKVRFIVDSKIEMDYDINNYYSSQKNGTVKELAKGDYEIKSANSIIVEGRLFLVRKHQ